MKTTKTKNATAAFEQSLAKPAQVQYVLRLYVAGMTSHSIRNGEVDAVVVTGKRGEQVYTLSGTDRIYRQLIETMSEGAVTLSADGVILYCNVCLAEMLGRPLEQVLGTALRNYLPPADRQALDAILAQARSCGPLPRCFRCEQTLPIRSISPRFCRGRRCRMWTLPWVGRGRNST